MEDDELLEDCGLEELYSAKLPQTIPAHKPQLRKLTAELEELQRTNPEQFFQRMQEFSSFINQL